MVKKLFEKVSAGSLNCRTDSDFFIREIRRGTLEKGQRELFSKHFSGQDRPEKDYLVSLSE